MKRLLSVFAILVVLGCASTRSQIQHEERNEVQDMMDSTVKIELEADLKFMKLDGTTEDMGRQVLGAGSGVVYEKFDDAGGRTRSRILTAMHVLGHKDGDSEYVPFAGVIYIKNLKFKVITLDKKVCTLEPIALGSLDKVSGSGIHDVAIGEANCDAGRVAPLGLKSPESGSKVFISGYSMGLEWNMVTEGYAAGWDSDGLQIVSAPSTGGNSGGPVFYNGEVIGLLVMGYPAYEHISVVVPLSELYARIQQADELN